MDKEEFIEELGIEGEPSYDNDGNFTIDLADQAAWKSAQVTLENPENGLEENPSSSQLEKNSSSLQYTNDDFIINLVAHFGLDPETKESYRLVIQDK